MDFERMFCIIISMFICLCLPSVIAAVMIIRRKGSWKAFVLGIAVFMVFQIFTRLPLLEFLQTTGWFRLFSQANAIAYILVLAFTAGLFEEGGRFIGMRFFMNNNLTWNNGILFGLGHGGVEAFVLIGMPILISVISGDSAVSGAPPYMLLVSSLERALTILVHIGMTMMVLYGVKFRKVRFLVYALLFHTAVDSGLLLNLAFGPNLWIVEGYLTVFAALAVLVTARMKPVIDNYNSMKIKWRL